MWPWQDVNVALAHLSLTLSLRFTVPAVQLRLHLQVTTNSTIDRCSPTYCSATNASFSACATRSPSTAAETIPPAKPAPSPAGYNLPRRDVRITPLSPTPTTNATPLRNTPPLHTTHPRSVVASQLLRSRATCTGAEVRVSTPCSSASSQSKPGREAANLRMPSRSACVSGGG